jgi:hypothetical protein
MEKFENLLMEIWWLYKDIELLLSAVGLALLLLIFAVVRMVIRGCIRTMYHAMK